MKNQNQNTGLLAALCAGTLIAMAGAAGCKEKSPDQKAADRHAEDMKDVSKQIKKDAEVNKDRTKDAIDKAENRTKEDVGAAADAAKKAAEEKAKREKEEADRLAEQAKKAAEAAKGKP